MSRKKIKQISNETGTVLFEERFIPTTAVAFENIIITYDRPDSKLFNKNRGGWNGELEHPQSPIGKLELPAVAPYPRQPIVPLTHLEALYITEVLGERETENEGSTFTTPMIVRAYKTPTKFGILWLEVSNNLFIPSPHVEQVTKPETIVDKLAPHFFTVDLEPLFSEVETALNNQPGKSVKPGVELDNEYKWEHVEELGYLLVAWLNQHENDLKPAQKKWVNMAQLYVDKLENGPLRMNLLQQILNLTVHMKGR